MPKQIFLDHPTIDETDIQGDVLVGMQKKAEIFVFFAIRDAAQFRQDLKRLVPKIATTRLTRKYEEAASAKSAGQPFNPEDLAAELKINVAFTAAGIGKLGMPITGADPSFTAGMEAGAGGLGDDIQDWAPVYRGQQIDGMFLVAFWARHIDHAETEALNAVSALLGAFAPGGMAELGREVGSLNRAHPGHEVFGFADGVSQPAVDGLHKPVADDDQSLPGQDIVKLGDFVLGPYDRETGKQATPPQPWMKNGSYLVFRRLRQDVAGFNDYTQNHFNGFADDGDAFAAKLIGRWKDGSPLARDPLRPNPAHDENQFTENNDFEFGVQKVAQTRCPFNAHIRRVYPRSDVQDGPGNAEQRRILRAGIAFDHGNGGGNGGGNGNGDGNNGDQGLLFVCYQSSIVDKFQFIQTFWANADSIPFVPPYVAGLEGTMPSQPGIDLIIGQAATRGANWDGNKVLQNVPKFVTATGGEYFFIPSISGLQSMTA
jgi:Dyp-type peroxidase family